MRRILIIDDEDDIRSVGALSLEATTDWEVLTAASGPEGVATAAARQPDAILLDVMMPGTDGPSTIGHLRKDAATAAIPVLLLTARIQPADLDRFSTLGVAAVLAKPFDPFSLAQQIRDVLHWLD